MTARSGTSAQGRLCVACGQRPVHDPASELCEKCAVALAPDRYLDAGPENGYYADGGKRGGRE